MEARVKALIRVPGEAKVPLWTTLIPDMDEDAGMVRAKVVEGALLLMEKRLLLAGKGVKVDAGVKDERATASDRDFKKCIKKDFIFLTLSCVLDISRHNCTQRVD